MKRPTLQRGFTLIELLVAMSIALFLMGGLVSLVFALKRTNTIQTGLSQLQENERLAMTLMGDVIQSAGYYPIKPVGWVPGQPLNAAMTELPAVGAFTTSGQAIVGTGTGSTTTPPFDTVAVRYLTSGSDNVINCTGSTSTVPGTVFINQFQVATVNGTSYLQCVLTVNGGAPKTINLVPGVASMQVIYGVKTNSGAATNSVDAYVTAQNVPNWSNVLSVTVNFQFVNPLYGQPSQPQYVPLNGQFDVMNQL
jgi:type IV pilus assembly protein PilW